MPYFRRSVFKQRFRHFDPNIFKSSRSVYLVGYWQSEKYFKNIEEILRSELTIKHNQGPDNQAMSCLINQTESVSLHIRRGDYVSNPISYQAHGICSLDYYRAAVETLTKTVKQPHFFIFSDDIEWAQENLKLDHPLTNVSNNGEVQDYEDLRLISHCKHHIIANSSFSWWGAWLCSHSQKIVIAPKKWFNNPKLNTRDLIPNEWYRI